MERKAHSPISWVLLVTTILAFALTPNLVRHSFDKDDGRGTALLIFILIACLCSWKWLSKRR